MNNDAKCSVAGCAKHSAFQSIYCFEHYAQAAGEHRIDTEPFGEDDF